MDLLLLLSLLSKVGLGLMERAWHGTLPCASPQERMPLALISSPSLFYVKAMHKRLFKASWRVKTALSLANAERRKNAEDAPAGSEDKESDLEYYEHPFSSDEDEEEDVESAYQGDE